MNIKVRNYIQKETKFGLYNKETCKDLSQNYLKKI